VHLNDNTIPTPLAGMLCNSATCGEIDFTAGATGTFTASVVFPTDQAQIDLVLCQQGAAPADPLDQTCPMGSAQVQCARTQVVNTDGTTTVTIVCPVTVSTNYTLLVVPNAVFTCDIGTDPFNPCPGVTVPVTYGISTTGGGGANGGGGGGTSGTVGKITGGGKVDFGASPFSIMAIASSARYDQGHVKYFGKAGTPTATGVPTCKFIATTITMVLVNSFPGTQAGDADVWGTGYINGNKSNTQPFHVHVVDGGEGASNPADAFDLKAGPNSKFGGDDTNPVCSTANSHVDNGNTQIHPTS
jgi:hypothetical protein